MLFTFTQFAQCKQLPLPVVLQLPAIGTQTTKRQYPMHNAAHKNKPFVLTSQIVASMASNLIRILKSPSQRVPAAGFLTSRCMARIRPISTSASMRQMDPSAGPASTAGRDSNTTVGIEANEYTGYAGPITGGTRGSTSSGAGRAFASDTPARKVVYTPGKVIRSASGRGPRMIVEDEPSRDYETIAQVNAQARSEYIGPETENIPISGIGAVYGKQASIDPLPADARPKASGELVGRAALTAGASPDIRSIEETNRRAGSEAIGPDTEHIPVGEGKVLSMEYPADPRARVSPGQAPRASWAPTSSRD